MTEPSSPGRPPQNPTAAALFHFFDSARLSAALSTAIIATGFLAFFIRTLIGWAGLIAILATLAVLAAAALAARRDSLEWRGILPLSLLFFIGWSALSIFWSQYQWSTLGGLAYQAVFAGLAVFVALTRDLIQIVRAVGDVLRVVLMLSLALEILSGVLIDVPIRFLGISGDIAYFGPIQGVEGTRNQLGLVALLALVTFGTELLTKSVRRGVGIGSIVTAGATVLLSQSPVSLGVLAVLGVASLTLLGLRRTTPERRRVWQGAFIAVGVVAFGVLYGARDRLLGIMDASNELNVRLDVWRELGLLITQHTLEGWGWVGTWRPQLSPFYAIRSAPSGEHVSALNAYIDVWFQLGLVGLFAFVTLALLAFGRSWILASRKRSRVYVWPALMLVTLLTTSLAESLALVDFGWMILVICSVKAAQELSWRHSLPD